MRSPSRRARAAPSTAPRSSAIESVAVTGQSYGPTPARVRWPLARSRPQRRPLQPARPRSRPRGDRRGRRRASSGASATWSATAPSPTPAPSWCASAATSAWSATTTSRCSARLDISSFSETARGGGRVDPRAGRRGDPGVPRGSRAGDATREGIGLFHASPRDPIWEYVLSTEQAEAGLDAQAERIGLIGHSHVALFFCRPEQGHGAATPTAPRRATARSSTSTAAPGCSTPAASASRATAIRAPPGWSSTPRSWTARYHRVSYDIARAAEAILAAGLPEPPRASAWSRRTLMAQLQGKSGLGVVV